MSKFIPLTFDVGVDRGYGKASGNTRGFSASSHWPYQPEDDVDEEEREDDLDFFLGKGDEVVDTLLNKILPPITGDSNSAHRSSGHSAEFAGMREDQIRTVVRESLVKISDRLTQQAPYKDSFGQVVPQPKAYDSHIKCVNKEEDEEEEEEIFRIKTLFKKFHDERGTI